ncbi:MAG: hypothetical protein ACJASB_000964 [Shewanella psychromarinicola]|jgi:hypothetical protein
MPATPDQAIRPIKKPDHVRVQFISDKLACTMCPEINIIGSGKKCTVALQITQSNAKEIAAEIAIVVDFILIASFNIARVKLS